MEKFGRKRVVNLATNARDVDVDHIVHGGIADGCLPYIPCNHLARNNRPTIEQEIFQQIKFPPGEIEQFAAPSRDPPSNVHPEVGKLEHGIA